MDRLTWTLLGVALVVGLILLLIPARETTDFDLSPRPAAEEPTATTNQPAPVVTMPAPTPTPSGPCNCAGPDLDCAYFSTHAAAQACYEFCLSQGYGDVCRLDGDNDGIACESLL